jgi:1,4-dihydroxy-2-naphthoate octaprenyltransferase
VGYFLPFFSFFGASFFFGVAFFSAHFVPQAMLTHPLSKTILFKMVFVVNNNVSATRR